MKIVITKNNVREEIKINEDYSFQDFKQYYEKHSNSITRFSIEFEGSSYEQFKAVEKLILNL